MKHIFLPVLCFISALINAQNIENIKKEKPIVLTGALSSGFQAYKVYGIAPRSSNPMWNINGSANLAVYGFDIPLSFTVGRQGNNINYPAFRQFGASPQWRWLTVHAGWRNMTFSPYTLAGHTFLGGGIEINPGLFRFAAMAGRFRSARAESSGPDQQYFPATYRRNGYGGRIGIGRRDQYFDLIWFKAKDDPESLKIIPEDITNTPGENAVAGYATRFNLGSHCTFFSDGALSYFTRNLFSKTLTDSSIVPEIPLLPEPRFSTRLNFAAKAGLDFHFNHFGLKAAYERIAPNFETMGAYFFNNDIENYTITPNFAFAKNKARFFGTLGIQKNNLAGNRSETTKRAIGNAVLSVNPSPRFGMELNYMNVGVNQREGKALLNDSVRVAVTNSNIGITPHWSFIDSIKSANLVISAQYQQVNDRNPFTREFANMNTKFVTANFIQNFVQNEWGWSAGINFNNIAVYQLNSNRYGITLGCNKSWNDGIGAATFSATYNLSDISGARDGSVWSLNSTLHWRFGKRVNLSVNANLLRNQSTQFEDYTELQGGISVSRRFGK